MKKVFLEAILVAFAGAVLAFAANALSPRGLKLTWDYFPGASVTHTTASVQTNAIPGQSNTNSQWELLAAKMKEKGLQLIDGEQAAKLFHDPRLANDLVVFIDARNDEHYRDGHIPGAYQFDHYHPDKFLGSIIPLCQKAEQVVVYCNGGECEDSEFAAITLGNFVPKDKLFVYGGGITEWTGKGLPVETGERRGAASASATK